jgi:hypothetical protein
MEGLLHTCSGLTADAVHTCVGGLCTGGNHHQFVTTHRPHSNPLMPNMYGGTPPCLRCWIAIHCPQCVTCKPLGMLTAHIMWGCRRERARAVTTVFGALDVGSAVGLLICGPLIHAYGWPSVFYFFAVAGFLWCLAWPIFKPEQSVLATAGPPPAPSSKPLLGPLLQDCCAVMCSLLKQSVC